MATWRYIKGSEKDFEGAPEWVLYCAQVKSCSRRLEAWEGENNRYCYTPRSEGDSVPLIENNDGGFINWEWSNKVEVIAQRERVTSINDDRLAQEMRPRSIVKPDGAIDFGCIQTPLVIDNVNPKYNRSCKGVTIDVYDVLQAFNVTNPALQHLVKKALAVGQRGHKDKMEDLRDILASAQRAIELEEMGE